MKRILDSVAVLNLPMIDGGVSNSNRIALLGKTPRFAQVCFEEKPACPRILSRLATTCVPG